MIPNIIKTVKYFFCVLLVFLLVQKPLFLLLNYELAGKYIGLHDLWEIYRHGMALDIASSCYVAAVPLLITLIVYLLKSEKIASAVRIWNGIAAFIVAVITIVDGSLYEFWEFKIDNTIFLYIDDPKNAFASVSVWYVLWRVMLIIFLTFIIYKVYNIPFSYKTKEMPKNHRILEKWYVSFPVWVLCGGLLFAGIRGIELWPNAPAKAYYSNIAFHNHSAVNPLFNLVYSLTHRNSFSKEMRFMSNDEAEQIVPALFPKGGTTEKIITAERPNILLIILEGMGSIFIDSLNNPDRMVAAESGEYPYQAAPNLSRLMSEGICFDQCYCGSFRTDRGVVCAISGLLGQPTTSIMRYSRIVQTLPGLPKSLKEKGYSTEMVYTSDITFFNMSDYFLTVGYDHLVSQDDFPSEQRSTSWGVPDHLSSEWLLEQICKRDSLSSGNPWFTTYLTISSHTPFDVPYDGLKDEKLNGFAYTDMCIGNFIDSLRNTPSWSNLLVVITADHGFNHREIASENFPLIPLLFTGGVVTENRRISKPVSQTDIPATILGQLGIDHSDYIYSRDVLSDSYTYPFAFNTFNNGFNFRDSAGVTIYDNDAKKVIVGKNENQELMGKAILQYLYNDLAKR